MAALSIGASPLAGANPNAADAEPSLSSETVKASMVHIDIKFSGYVVSEDETGKTVVSPDKTTALQSCSGAFVSERGDILTAEHCLNKDMGRQAIMDAFRPMPFAASGKLPDDLFTMFEPSTILGVWGDGGSEMEGLPIPGSDPDMEITVWQQQYMPGAVLTQQPAVKAVFVGSTPIDQGDVAVIRIPVPMKTPALPVAVSTPNFDDDIFAAGYPASVSLELADENPMQEPSIMKGSVALQQPYDMGKPGMQVTATMGHGMSGGPVVNKHGAIVGVVSNIASEGFSFASGTDDVLHVLQTNLVHFQAEQLPQPVINTASSEPLNDSTHAASGIPAFWAGVLLTLLATVVIVAILKRNTWIPAVWSRTWRFWP
jgi:serine protease Do